MSGNGPERTDATRRRFLTGAAGAVGAAATVTPAHSSPQAVSDVLPFHGPHQNGIALPMQSHAYFAAFDLAAETRDEVVALLKAWTAAAARLADGKPAQDLEAELQPAVTLASAKDAAAYGASPQGATADAGETQGETLGEPPGGAMGAQGPQSAAGDTGETMGQPAARLTLTFGFGAGLFTKDGKDRYGLAAKRPAALVDLPKFVGDQLVEAQSGGDLLVQACADDPQVAFHAVRQLARIAGDATKLRWVQTGFVPDAGTGQTPRNLMGFKDGTNNPKHDDPEAMGRFVWAGDEGPAWMKGGTYMVTRRIRIALEHWDRMKVSFQEETLGRHKYSGAPIGRKKEHDDLDLAATDKAGNPLIVENAHVRLATAATNDGAQILRRGYSYNDGVNFTTERWPPWRQGLEYDSGLFFVAFQRDPRTGFVKIFERMAKFDMLNQFVTHVGSGHFACPPGVVAGDYLGQRLFEDRA